MTKKRKDDRVVPQSGDTNPDPITNEPGSHPVGTGIGAALGGAAVGAAAGLAAGPIGAVVGAVGGGVAGGAVGKEVAERFDPTAEDAYWRENYPNRPYYNPEIDYEKYRPAYQYGWESRQRYPDRDWQEIEADLAREWERDRDDYAMKWEDAAPAARDAWQRIPRAGTPTFPPQKPR